MVRGTGRAGQSFGGWLLCCYNPVMYQHTATVSLNLRVSPELREWLEQQARKAGISVTRLVANMLEERRGASASTPPAVSAQSL